MLIRGFEFADDVLGTGIDDDDDDDDVDIDDVVVVVWDLFWSLFFCFNCRSTFDRSFGVSTAYPYGSKYPYN